MKPRVARRAESRRDIAKFRAKKTNRLLWLIWASHNLISRARISELT